MKELEKEIWLTVLFPKRDSNCCCSRTLSTTTSEFAALDSAIGVSVEEVVNHERPAGSSLNQSVIG